MQTVFCSYASPSERNTNIPSSHPRLRRRDGRRGRIRCRCLLDLLQQHVLSDCRLPPWAVVYTPARQKACPTSSLEGAPYLEHLPELPSQLSRELLEVSVG